MSGYSMAGQRPSKSQRASSKGGWSRVDRAGVPTPPRDSKPGIRASLEKGLSRSRRHIPLTREWDRARKLKIAPHLAFDNVEDVDEWHISTLRLLEAFYKERALEKNGKFVYDPPPASSEPHIPDPAE